MENKELHIWMDIQYPKNTIHDHKTVNDVLSNEEQKIVHTTNTHFCSTVYLVKKYRIFVHMIDGDIVEIVLGSENKYTDKEIRIAHNLEKLLLCNCFGYAVKDSIDDIFESKQNKYKINIRFGYDELYPKEEHEINDEDFHINQVGTCNFESMIFYPEVGEQINFIYGKEFEVEHDTIVGLPVYITILKIRRNK